MCILTKGAILYLVAAPLPTIGGHAIPGALQTQEHTYVFDDKGICERHVGTLLCAQVQLVTCPTTKAKR